MREYKFNYFSSKEVLVNQYWFTSSMSFLVSVNKKTLDIK